MLQAITLENSPTLPKGQAGNKCASDPSDTLFAGVMAQTTLASPTTQTQARTHASSVPNGSRTRAEDPSPSKAATPEVGTKAKTAGSQPSPEAPQLPPETTPPGSASEGTPEAQQVPAGLDAPVARETGPDGEEPSSETVAAQPALPQPQIFMGLVPVAAPPQAPQQVIQDQDSPAVSSEQLLAASSQTTTSRPGLDLVPPAPESTPFEGSPADDPGLSAQAREAIGGTADPLSLIHSSAVSGSSQASTQAAAARPDLEVAPLAPESVPSEVLPVNDPGLSARPQAREATSGTADPLSRAGSSSAGTIPQEISQTFTLDAKAASSVDTPSSDPVFPEHPETAGTDGTTPSATSPRTAAGPAPATAASQDLEAASRDSKTTPAVKLAGSLTARLKPVENPDSAPVKNTTPSAAGRSASVEGEVPPAKAAKSGDAEAPESSRNLSRTSPSDTDPEVKPEQDRGKDPLPSSSTAREEAALTGLGRPADSALVQKAHTASAEAFVQPAGAELKTGSGTPQADNLAAARSHPVFTQVEGSIRWIIQNKSQEAELQLHPDSLGRVTIQLKVEGQEVHAHLWASEASSLPILQEHKASLEASLKEQGLNLGSFNLHFGARHDQSQTASQTWNMSHASKSFLSAEGKQEIPSRSADPGLLSSMDPHQIEVYA